MYNIDDPRNYKRCQKKKYNVWVCMPPLGTCVINKLEQAQVVKRFNGKTYFTANLMKKLAMEDEDTYTFLSKNAYIVDEKKRFVLSGTQGEMWTIDANKLANTYVFATGNDGVRKEEINMDAIRKRCLKKTLLMNWQLLETKPIKGSNFAMQIPANEAFQLKTAWGSVLTGNDPLVEHGKGDFIMCPANMDGTPNLGDRWIVNGLIFGDTYDNRGWSDKVVSNKDENYFLEKPKVQFFNNNDVKDHIGKNSADIVKELAHLITTQSDKNTVDNNLRKFTNEDAVMELVKNDDGTNRWISIEYNKFIEPGKPNNTYATILISYQSKKVSVHLRTFNSKGVLSFSKAGSIQLQQNVEQSYNELAVLVQDLISAFVGCEADKTIQDTRSNKQKASDVLNIFGSKKTKETPKKANVTSQVSGSQTAVETQSDPNIKKKTKKNTMYQMVARCTDGFKVTGFMLKPTDNTEPAKKFSRQQTYFLVGKKMIINCDGKISKEGISLSGIGTKITDLPMLDESGTIRNAEHTGHVRRGDKAEDIINRNMIVGIVKNGRSTEGYILKGAGGATSFCSKDDVYKLAQERKIGNVSAQMYNGKLLIRSIPGQPSLSSLPIMDRDGNTLKDKTDFSVYRKKNNKQEA